MNYRALIYREGQRGWTVWLVSQATGSRVECLGHANSLREARTIAKRYNAKAS